MNITASKLLQVWTMHNEVEIHWAVFSLPSMSMMYIEERRSADTIEIDTGE